MKAILAMSSNRCIGKDGKLPWLPFKDDFKWFKEFTMGHTLIVGRKTFEGLPPLKGRKVCLITNNKSNIFEVYQTNVSKFDHLFIRTYDEMKLSDWDNSIVIGGKSIYELFLPQITEFYITCIDKKYDGDTFMEPFEHLFSKQEVVKEFGFGKVIKYER